MGGSAGWISLATRASAVVRRCVQSWSRRRSATVAGLVSRLLAQEDPLVGFEVGNGEVHVGRPLVGDRRLGEGDVPLLVTGREEPAEALDMHEADVLESELPRQRASEVDLEALGEDDLLPTDGADLEARARQVQADDESTGPLLFSPSPARPAAPLRPSAPAAAASAGSLRLSPSRARRLALALGGGRRLFRRGCRRCGRGAGRRGRLGALAGRAAAAENEGSQDREEGSDAPARHDVARTRTGVPSGAKE